MSQTVRYFYKGECLAEIEGGTPPAYDQRLKLRRVPETEAKTYEVDQIELLVESGAQVPNEQHWEITLRRAIGRG